ncbi:unnamed protein product [Vicia faba]|uniref:RRM domain-containing protein n=1 Tax=Vicia faba TaxID=3906 RepID=A0AAV1AX30_VICFA|nr:unnamed protein product [Vicia faba]
MAWTTVKMRGFQNVASRWDSFPTGQGSHGVEEKMLSSIFLFEFPDRIRASDIFELFGCTDEVMEVVIPPKRKNLGKRFGFSRFKEVEDSRVLAIKVDNIMIDGKKICANPPMFDRSVQNGGSGREGYFSVKVSNLGANLVLLEELEECVISCLIKEGKSWLNHWFYNIRAWKEDDVDNEKEGWTNGGSNDKGEDGFDSHDISSTQAEENWSDDSEFKRGVNSIEGVGKEVIGSADFVKFSTAEKMAVGGSFDDSIGLAKTFSFSSGNCRKYFFVFFPKGLE